MWEHRADTINTSIGPFSSHKHTVVVDHTVHVDVWLMLYHDAMPENLQMWSGIANTEH